MRILDILTPRLSRISGSSARVRGARDTDVSPASGTDDATARLNHFADAAGLVFWETNEKHRFTWISTSEKSVLRYFSDRDVLGRTRWEILGLDIKTDAEAQRYRALLDRHEAFASEEFRHTLPDGRIVVRESSARPVFDGAGVFKGFRGTTRDISDTEQRHRSAESTREHLAGAIQSAEQGIALFDSEDRLVYANDTAHRYRWPIVANATPGARFEDVLRNAVATGKVGEAASDGEDWIRRRMDYHRNPVGEWATVERLGQYFEIRDERVPDGGTMIYITNVTQQIAIQNALRESENRFRSFAESSADWLWETDSRHRLTWVSESVQRHSEISVEATIGRTRWDALGIDVEREQAWQELIATMDARERIREFRYSRRNKNGENLHRSINGVPCYDDQGEFQGYRGTITDLTALVEAETRARDTERRFLEAMDGAGEGLILLDADDRIVFFNQKSRKFFGDAAADILPGCTFEEMLRAFAAAGVLGVPAEAADGWIAERLEQHRSGNTRLRRRLYDNTVAEIREERLPDGGMIIFQNDITARIEAEAAQLEMESRFRDFAEASSDWLWETDADFKFTWVSNRSNPAPDVDPDNFLGKTRWEFLGGDVDSDAELRRHIEDQLERRPFRDFRYSRIDSSGQTRHRSVSGIPYFDPETDEFLGYRGTTTDITETVEAEERYRKLIEQSPFPIIVHRGEEIVFANAAAEKLYVREPEETMPGRRITDFIPAPEMAAYLDSVDRVLRGGEALPLTERKRQRSDGSEIVVMARSVPVLWEGERAIMVSQIDITDRVRAERQYQDLIENAPFAISMDDGHRFLYANAAFVKMFGAASPEEVIGRRISDMSLPEEHELFEERVSRVFNQRKSLPTAEIRRRRFDGDIITVLSRAEPVFWEGKPATLGIQVDISERIAAQEALRDSEERFRNLVEGSGQGVLLHVDFKPVFANSVLAEMFGYESVDDVLALESVLSLVSPEEREKWISYKEARMAGRDVPERYEFVGLHRNGKRIWLHISVRVVNWEGRTALQGTMIDVTDRRLAEDAIRESEERFRLLTSTSPFGIFVADRNGGCSYINPAYEKISGQSPEEATGDGWSRAIHPEDRERLIAEWATTARTFVPFRTEFRFLHKDGKIVWCIAQAIAQRDADGGVTGFIGAVTDVTARKRAEQALLDSEEKFRTLSALAPVGVFLSDAEGVVDYVNSAYANVIGLPQQKIVGSNWLAGVFAEDRPLIDDAWNRTISDGKGFEIEARLGLTEETVVWGIIQVSPLLSPDGTVGGYIGAITDITDRRNTEEQMRQIQKMDAIGQLTGGIAHDFNNLLAIVQGNLELLSERAPDSERLGTLINAALGATKRGAILNQRLLAFARRQPLRPSKCDINRIVDDMAGLFVRTLGGNIDLKTDFAANLWPAKVDPNGLETAVLNLAINARDAMPDGGALTITTWNISIERLGSLPDADLVPGDYVALKVTDTGTGMDAETLSRAFDPFFTTKQMGKGSGLGLSMVYGFARQSGGCTTIESKPGLGTAVCLYLPREKQESPAHVVRMEDSPPVGSGERVLVVEDDEDVRSMAIEMFESLNYAPVEAGNADEALAILEADSRIDLLFTDVMLGSGPNGPELARIARSRHPRLRVLFASGYAKVEFEGSEPIEAGELLSKPYARSALARAVRDALDLAEA